MIKLDIKPLSVNEAYSGRRVKTEKYRVFEKEVWYSLPRGNVPRGKLGLRVEFGFSNEGSDVDNGVKNFLDILQNKYTFNDKMVYEINAKKTITKKGEEFIKYELYAYKATA